MKDVVTEASEEAAPLRGAADNRPSDPELPDGYTTWKTRSPLLFLTALSGVGYLSLQQVQLGSVKDAVFVSMLVGATAILLYGLRYVKRYLVRRGLDFYEFVLASDDPSSAYERHRRLCASVFDTKRMTLVGTVYGLLVSTCPYLLGLWPGHPSLLLSLSTFIFFVNYSTGVSFYGLVLFFYYSVKMGRYVNVDIWRVNKPSTGFLLGATRRISILVSIYAGICNTSMIFSIQPITPPIIAFFIFSAVTILASVVVPSIPIAWKLRRAKMEAINEIERQLHETLKESLRKAKKSGEDVSTEEFESLLTMKEKIEAVHSWPFRIKSIVAGISVVFFSSAPLLVESVLQMFLGG